MKRKSLLLLLLSSVLLAQLSWAESNHNSVFQVSTFSSLKRGSYDGQVSFQHLKSFGDFGIGTLEGIDGEMIALDGRFFQVKTDGKAYEIDDAASTPFAVVTFFKPDDQFVRTRIESLKYLHQLLDDRIPSMDLPCALKIEGKFTFMKVRSVSGQEKPYPNLEVVLRNQVIFEFKDIVGTLVGFRFPDFMEGVNVPGYHFHFVDAERKTGGHVLDCGAESVKIGISSLSDFRMTLSADPSRNK